MWESESRYIPNPDKTAQYLSVEGNSYERESLYNLKWYL